jgi:hypothetical protein
MEITAKFKSHNPTENGEGNRQKEASILFSDKFWAENEGLNKLDNGDLIT